MRRLYLLEPALKGVGGHCFEYAASVLEAARAAGLTTVLATHLSLDGQARATLVASGAIDDTCILPVFRYEHGVNPYEFAWLRVAKTFEAAVSRQMFRLFPKLSARAAIDSAERCSESSDHSGVCSTYGQSLPLPARTGVSSSMIAALSGVRQRAAEVCLGTAYEKKVSRLRRDLEAVFEHWPQQSEDIVFMPTIDWADVDGLGRLFVAGKGYSVADWHLMFRFPIFSGREPEYESQLARVRRQRDLLVKLRSAGIPEKIHFHTDTDELSHQYGRLGLGAFDCLPIPHTKPRLAQRATSSRPLRIIYLGDARVEKGYLQLPHLVGEVYDEYLKTGRAMFRIQSSFNVPGGEPGIAAARGELETYPREHVEVIRHRLSPQDYAAMLHDGDVSLALYDPTSYYARSSGILMESLSAGLPVLTFAGGWLAAQFAAATRDHHAGIRQQAAVLASYTFSAAECILTDRSGNATSINSSVPSGAQAVMLSLEINQDQPGVFAKVRVQGRDAFGNPQRVRSECLGPLLATDRLTAIIPLALPAARIRLSISNPFGRQVPLIDRVHLEFLQAAEHATAFPPVGYAGRAVAERRECGSILKELLDQIDHYQQTAALLSAAGVGRQDARRLVDILRGP